MSCVWDEVAEGGDSDCESPEDDGANGAAGQPGQDEDVAHGHNEDVDWAEESPDGPDCHDQENW